MDGLLTPSHYTDSMMFEREQERIFGHLWVFAGLAQFVSAPDEFLTRRIGGRDVLIQNFDGALRAYENVCRHRGKALQSEAFGKRPLYCGYHGWRYDSDGRVATIPYEAECYRFDASTRTSLRLTEFALRRVGNLLFVNVSDAPPPFEDQFDGELLRSIESASSAFDSEVMVATVTGRYNWKLAYENLRDSLHPRFVHTRTLNLEVDFGGGVSDALVARELEGRDVDLRQLSFGGPEGTFRQARAQPFHGQVERWGAQDAYFNWLLYPNTHMVCPDGGYLFSIEHHQPVAPDVTELTLFFMTARRRRSFAGTSTVLWDYAQGAKVILDEDRAVMEETQVGLTGMTGLTTQGQFEMQNRITDRWYRGRMA